MLFPKSVKSVFILVQCITEQKLCCTFRNCVCLSALSGSLCIWNQS